MENAEIRLPGRQQHDRILAGFGEGVGDHLPVRPVLQDVAADDPAQRTPGLLAWPSRALYP